MLKAKNAFLPSAVLSRPCTGSDELKRKRETAVWRMCFLALFTAYRNTFMSKITIYKCHATYSFYLELPMFKCGQRQQVLKQIENKLSEEKT